MKKLIAILLAVLLCQGATAMAANPAASGALPDLRSATVGDIITLGWYEQNGNLVDGKEPIEWVVLEKDAGRVLVISRYILERIVYDSLSTGFSPAWDDSAVCLWLNGAFYQGAFSAAEKSLIQTVTNYNIVQNSQDKIFLLGESEAKLLFNSKSARRARPTRYAASNNDWTAWRTSEEESYDELSEYGETAWLLRPEALYSDCAAYVDGSGEIHEAYGNGLGDYINGVRPAMWLQYSRSGEVRTSARGRPGPADLDAINTDVVYPARREYYLSEYVTKYVQASKNRSAVYAFIDPNKDNVMAEDNYYKVYNGTEVTVIAQSKGYACVIIPSMSRAGWINASFLVDG